MATPGTVNQALLESFYQDPGQVYLDSQTEGAFQVLADQINVNALIFTANGSTYLISPAIPGITGTTVYDQLAFLETQIQAITGGVVAPGTITTALLQDGAVTHVKLSPSEQTASAASMLNAQSTLGGL